jgi:hypothetical protein
MKYRKLDREELESLETEFIRFLTANTVTGDDWVKIKAESPDKAEQLIEMFSDIVFEKILDGVEYLEFKSPQDYKTFHCTEDRIYLLGLRVEGNTELDFTSELPPQEMIRQLQNSDASLKLYAAEKAYKPERRQELFRMMESGALISKDGAMYKLLEGLR